jgi:hypothetical protein
MTTKAALWLQEREEEARLTRAAQRPTEEQSREEPVQNRVEREQKELAILLHNRKMREERKEKKRRGTLERARPRVAWEFPTIQRLGNQALVKESDDKDGPTSQATFGNASEGGAHPRVGVKQVIIKPAKIGTGFRITKHVSGSKDEIPFPQRGSKSVKSVHQPAAADAASKSVTL